LGGTWDCAGGDCCCELPSTTTTTSPSNCNTYKLCDIQCGYGPWVGWKSCQSTYVDGDYCYWGVGCCQCWEYGACSPCDGYGWCSYGSRQGGKPSEGDCCTVNCVTGGWEVVWDTPYNDNICVGKYGTGYECQSDCTCIPPPTTTTSTTTTTPTTIPCSISSGGACEGSYNWMCSDSEPARWCSDRKYYTSVHASSGDQWCVDNWAEDMCWCIDPTNVECCLDSDCTEPSKPLCDKTNHVCHAECTSDSDCTDPAKHRCYVSQGICVECYDFTVDNTHCGPTGDGVTCDDHGWDNRNALCEADVYTCTECGPCEFDEDCKDTCCDSDPDGPGGLGNCVVAGPYAPGSAYLCVVSSPAQWTNCNKNTVNTVIENNGNKYTCIVENGNYKWIEGSFTKTPQYSMIDLIVRFIQKIISFF